MTESIGNLTSSVVTGCNPTVPTPASAIGTLRGTLGSCAPLKEADWVTRVASPEETDARLIAALEQRSGQRIVLAYSTLHPNGGPTERVWDRIRWQFPIDKSEELAALVDGAFRAAPANALAGALYKLRTLTRGRVEAADDDREAEMAILIHELRKWPGDVVLHVLATWPMRPNGQFWPTWHELEKVLRLESQKRKTIAACLLKYGKEPAKAAEEENASQEARDRAIRHWEEVVKPMMKAAAESDEPRTDKPPPNLRGEALQAWWLARLEAIKDKPTPGLSDIARATNAGRPMGAPDLRYGPAAQAEAAE
jgi:hypothetical protein